MALEVIKKLANTTVAEFEEREVRLNVEAGQEWLIDLLRTDDDMLPEG